MRSLPQLSPLTLPSLAPRRGLAAVAMAFLLPLLLLGSARADEPALAIDLSSAATTTTDLSSALELYEDRDGSLDLAGAQRLAGAGHFGRHGIQQAGHRQRAGVFWGRLRLRPHAAPDAHPPTSWLLRFAFPYARWNEVTLYGQDAEGRPWVRRGGHDVPPSERALSEPGIGFPLSLPPGAEQVLYLRLVKRPHPGGFLSIRSAEITLQSAEHHLQETRELWLYQGIYLGIILIMIFYNIIIYTSERDVSLLWYCGMLVSLGIYFLEISGVGFYLPGLAGPFATWDWYGGGGLALTAILICFCQFGRHYLSLDRYSRPADWMLRLTTPLSAGPFLICYFSHNLQIGHFIIYLGALSSIVGSMGGAVHAAVRGFRPALFFLIATGIMAISGSSNLVRMLFSKIFYLPLLYANLFQLGTALQIALLALGLAYRMRLLRTEREKSERLLHNVLPEVIAERLKSGERAIAERFEEVSVLFADLVGFTGLSSQVEPERIVARLNTVFSRFDALSAKYGLEKIKTIGDCYMVVSGVPRRRPDHLQALLSMALELVAALRGPPQANEPAAAASDEPPLHVRIGIHTGPVVAGVLGTQRFAFDLWGDTVNTASRMESHGEPDRIQCTPEVYERMQHAFVFEERGEIEIKGKGRMRTYFLVGRRSAQEPVAINK
ncbi:MAG TPA: adenylate/guanylate cyclase domain-containing protein [Pseudomonadota bacterium]|nr:adenylate/guanylate cyclase domain-containing protein [Pseudomonadota bacterium]